MPLFPYQPSFVRGEVSPIAAGRVDLDWYRTSLERCENFVPLVQGGLKRRAGTRHVADVPVYHRLIAHDGGGGPSYCLAFSGVDLRVFAADGTLVQTLPHPWPGIDPARINSEQSNDVHYLVTTDGRRPSLLKREAVNDWRFEPMAFLDGPFETENGDRAFTIKASAQNGAVTLRASEPLFEPSDVGRVVLLRESDKSDVPQYVEGTSVGAGKFFRSNGKVYRSLNHMVAADNGGPASGTAPNHLIGDLDYGDPSQANDGAGSSRSGIGWRYIHDETGVVQITSVTGPYVAEGNVFSTRVNEDRPPATLPASVTKPAGTWRWSMSTFGGTNWPVAVAFFEERLCFAAGQQLSMSRPGAFTVFRGGPEADAALSLTIAGDRSSNVLWLGEANGFLLVGTESGMRAVAGTDGAPVKPGGVVQRYAVRGTRLAPIPPVPADDSLFCLSEPPIQVRETGYSAETNGFLSPNAALLSDHLLRDAGGCVDLAYQSSPETAMWLVMADGTMAAMTIDKTQAVQGWSRHTIAGGAVRAVAAAPGADGTDVWLTVERGGSHSIEVMRAAALDDDLTYADASLVSPNGTATHAAWANARIAWRSGERFGWVDADGSGVADAGTGAETVMGLAYTSRLRTLRMDMAGRDGSSMGRRQRVVQLVMDVVATSWLRLCRQVSGAERTDPLIGGTEADAAAGLAPVTGASRHPIPNSFDDAGQVEMCTDAAMPCLVRGIVPAFEREG